MEGHVVLVIFFVNEDVDTADGALVSGSVMGRLVIRISSSGSSRDSLQRRQLVFGDLWLLNQRDSVVW
jgi:hypothetical protein